MPLGLTEPFFAFLLLVLLTPLGHMYCDILAMSLGALASLYCRPFLGFYAIFFLRPIQGANLGLFQSLFVSLQRSTFPY